jgi:hypothetical protein
LDCSRCPLPEPRYFPLGQTSPCPSLSSRYCLLHRPVADQPLLAGGARQSLRNMLIGRRSAQSHQQQGKSTRWSDQMPKTTDTASARAHSARHTGCHGPLFFLSIPEIWWLPCSPHFPACLQSPFPSPTITTIPP